MKFYLPIVITFILSSLIFLFSVSHSYARIRHTHSFIFPTRTPRLLVTSTPTPTRMIEPTNTPTPTAKLFPTPTSVPTISSQSFNPVRDYIMSKINEYRSSQGLYAVKTNDLTCNFAKIRAQEISTDFSHNGFQGRINSHTLPYPNYSYITENIVMTSDYHQVVTLWINSAGHAANIRADTSYVCVEQYGSYFAYEGWKSL